MDTSILALPVHSRREFCARACQAAPQLTMVASTVTGPVISLTVEASSALASVGSAVAVQTSLDVSGVAHVAGRVLGSHCGLHARGLHGQRVREQPLRVSLPRIAILDHRSGADGAGVEPLQQYATQFANGVLTFSV